jgi:hypothetical protein
VQLACDDILGNNLRAFALRQADQARKLMQDLSQTPLFLQARCLATVMEWRAGDHEGIFHHDAQFGLDALTPDKQLCVLYGFGTGSFVRRLLEKTKVRHILVFEPSVSLFRDVISQIDVSGILNDERVSVILGCGTQNYIAEAERYLQSQFERIIFAGNFANLITLGIEKIPGYQDYCLQFTEAFRVATNNLLSTDTNFSQEDGFFGLRNTLRNAKTCQSFPVMSDFAGQFAGLPGIVIGSGPSLKKSLPLLRDLQDRAVLFACDSALKSLVSAGIEPHFVGCLERVSATKRLFHGIAGPIKSCLVATSSIQPDSITAFPGARKLMVQRDLGFDRWLYPSETFLNLGQTVSHLGLMGLHELGCQDIYLIGVDCAYDPDSGLSHVSDAPDFILKYGEWEKEKNVGISQLTETGYDGQPKKTMGIWYTDTFLFRDLIAAYDLTVYNVMPRHFGIPIPGTRHLEPELLPQRLPASAKPAQKIIDELFLKAPRQHYDTKSLIAQSLEFLTFVEKFCLEAIADLSQSWHDYDPCIEEYVPLYDAIFARSAQAQEIIMHQEGGLFWRVLFSIIQGFHVRNGNQWQRCYIDYPDPGLRITKQIQISIEWFTKVHSWSSRIAALMQQA